MLKQNSIFHSVLIAKLLQLMYLVKVIDFIISFYLKYFLVVIKYLVLIKVIVSKVLILMIEIINEYFF